MTTKVVNLRDFPDALGGFATTRLKDLKEATVRGCARSLPMLAQMSPVDTGKYASSWDMTVEEESVIIGNFAPHAPIIEFGARPYTPPIGPLLAWAKRVLRDPSQPPNYSPEVRSLAFAVQAKIARVGMQPRAVMQKAMPQIIDNIKQELAKL